LFNVPVIVASPTFVEAEVVTLKVTLVWPSWTVTCAGAFTVETEEVSLILLPPAGATEVNVTVPVELLPTVTVEGLNVMEAMLAGWRSKEVETLLAKYVAVSFTVVALRTAAGVTDNEAEVSPAGTVIVFGSTKAAELLVKLTTVSPPGLTLSMSTSTVYVLLAGVAVIDTTLTGFN
jgi:hypothetical protein